MIQAKRDLIIAKMLLRIQFMLVLQMILIMVLIVVVL